MRNHPDKASVAQYLDWNSSDGETAKSPYFAIYVGVDWRARPLLRAYRFLPHSHAKLKSDCARPAGPHVEGSSAIGLARA